MLVDNYDSEAESYMFHEDEVSPESKAIMAEIEKVYASSPIPKSYLISPLKKLEALPEILLTPKLSKEAKPTVAKKSMKASELLAKQGHKRTQSKGGVTNAKPRAQNEPSTTSFAATKAVYGGAKTRSLLEYWI